MTATKLELAKDWSFWGPATINDFPADVREAYEEFCAHADEVSADGASDAYIAALASVEERMVEWIGPLSGTGISWDGDPSDPAGLLAAMKRCVEAAAEVRAVG